MLHRRSLRLVAAGAVVSLVLGACSSSSAPQTTASSPPTTVGAAPPDDGVLRLGVILPRGGAGAELGQGLNNGVDLAIEEINSTGGTNGQQVRRIVREEGATASAAATALQDLIDAGVDVIIGPASSNVTLGILGHAVDAGVVVCSPTASALALDEFPDNGLFFRTIPSDSLQARAIAQAVDRTGTGRAVIASIDDAYGGPMAAAVESALRTLGIEVTLTVPFTSQESSLTAAARTVADQDPAVVVVIGDATTGPAMLTAIDLEAGDAPPTYVVNDAMRRPAATVQPYSPELASRVTGVSPLAYVESDRFVSELRRIDPTTTGLYAANAYDCVTLVALAAIASGSNAPDKLAAAMVSVSVNGSSCDRVSACRAELEAGLNIDYDGPDGLLSLKSNGDRDVAVFELFGFDDSGRDVTLGRLQISER